MEVFTKIFEFREDVSVPSLFVTVDNMRTHVIVMLLDEFTRVHIQHLHIGQTLNSLVVSHGPEEVPRPILNLHDGEFSIFVRHYPVYAPDYIVASTLNGTHLQCIKCIVNLVGWITFGSLLFVAYTVIREECFTNVFLGCFQFGTAQTTLRLNLVQDSAGFLFHL